MGPSLESEPLGSRPIALVLSGGAALGSWQGGVLYALEKRHGVSFHSVAGTSAGSLNGAAYFQDRTQDLRSLWRDIPNGAFMKLAPRISPPSVYSQAAVRSYLAGIIDEESARRARRCWFYVLSVDLRKGLDQAEYSPEPGGPWTAPLLDHILGSIAVPLLFPPVEVPAVNGAPGKTLVDGHLLSYIDLGRMVQRGALDFLFVNVASKTALSAPRYGARGYISTLVDRLLQGQIDGGLAGLGYVAAAKGLRAFELNPGKPLGISVFGFKREECRRCFDRGEDDAGTFMKDPGRFRIL